nr:calcium-binding EF hand family protein [Tanacetum cinerariifolium]
NYDEESHNSSHESNNDSLESPARRFFAELDKDADGYLSDVELLPIIGKLHPSERYYAKQQADYIISQADTDKDGRLSLTEMIDSPYVFYSAIFNEDDEEDYEYHDDLVLGFDDVSSADIETTFFICDRKEGLCGKWTGFNPDS